MKSSTSFILILMSLGLFYVFILPQYQEVKVLNTTASDYRNVLNNASDIVYMRDQLLVNYESIPPGDIEKMSKILPDYVDNVRLALDLDTMGSRYGISIREVQSSIESSHGSGAVNLPENEPPYGIASVSFSFTADHQNFMRFLSDIERSLRIMDVKSVSFMANASGLYDYKVSVQTYWLR